MKKFNRPILLGSSALASLLMSNLVQGQTVSRANPPADAAIQEVVVTASKTGVSKLQKTPDAISVVSGDQLSSQGVQNLKDLAQFIPNLSFNQNTASAAIYIRGIGSNNTGAGSDPDVTTQIDGVYIARPAGQMGDFLDVDRVEVLRGPQGTLYGRNAVGGTINILSKTPSKEFTGEAALSVGNYNLRQGSVYLSGPLSTSTQGSLAVNYVNHDGYFENVVAGQHDVGAANHGGVRGQLRWNVNKDIDATTRFDVAYGDEYFVTFSSLITPTAFPSVANSLIGNFRKVSLNTPQKNRSSSGGLSEEINWHLNDAWSLKSITAARFNKYKFTNDNDSTERNLTIFASEDEDKQVSQEFDLTYTSARFKGVTGLYYFHDTDRQRSFVTVVPAGITNLAAPPQIDSTSAAVFAQGTYNFTPEFSGLIGARYTHESKTMDQHFEGRFLASGAYRPGFPVDFSLERTFHAVTPKFGLNWQVTPRAMLYASVTDGYKSGGFNFGATNVATAGFRPEKLVSYEIGAKTDWLDRRLRLNATVFSYDYTDLQVLQLISSGVTSIGNAATAKVQGVELELIAKPTSAVKLTANLSTLDATYKSYPGAVVPSALVPFVTGVVCVGSVCTADASGHRMNAAPKLSGMAAIDYTTTGFGGRTVNAHLDYTWRDRTFFDPSNVDVMSQKAYGLVNAQIGIALSSNWGLQLWGKNLGDAKYFLVTAGSGTVPNGQPGDPRTVGMKLTHNW
jgi:iron complex outermembrane receptor protein